MTKVNVPIERPIAGKRSPDQLDSWEDAILRSLEDMLKRDADREERESASKDEPKKDSVPRAMG